VITGLVVGVIAAALLITASARDSRARHANRTKEGQ